MERLCRVAAKERGLKLAAVIEFSDVSIDRKKGASFSVVVDAMPDFELPDYRKIMAAFEKLQQKLHVHENLSWFDIAAWHSHCNR